VELLTGLMFLGCWLQYGRTSAAVALIMCLVMAGLIVATFIDLAHFIIPDEITIGGIVVGFLCSFAVPALHGAAGHGTRSLRDSFLGIVVGGLLVEAVRQAGKLAFGRLKVALPGETKVFFGEVGVALPDREIPYEEIFYRKSDAIRFHAKRVELADRCFVDTDVALSPQRLKIGSEQFNPEQNLYMEVVTDKLVLPREAMGFGDVKFMAAIGAFLGWQATIFSLVVSSFLGAIVGGILILLKRHERANPIPYGPYIAAAAAIWIFGGRPLTDWFLHRIVGWP
jgi:leader peptidase (prepilin peptidase)/N-methyltransferase